MTQSGIWTEWVGKRVGLMDRERKLYRLYSMRPCDKTWEQVQAERKEQDKPKRAERARKRRADLRAMLAHASAGGRDETVLVALTDKWRTLKQIMSDVRHSAVWKVTGDSFRRAVEREVKRLMKRGTVEIRKLPGRKGSRGLLQIRRKDQL